MAYTHICITHCIFVIFYWLGTDWKTKLELIVFSKFDRSKFISEKCIWLAKFWTPKLNKLFENIENWMDLYFEKQKKKKKTIQNWKIIGSSTCCETKKKTYDNTCGFQRYDYFSSVFKVILVILFPQKVNL